jgi:hypothetical protein
MKKAREYAPRKGFILQQCIKGATGIKRLRGRHHKTPAPSPVLLERGRLGNARVVVLALALLLFSLLGMITAITGANALTPQQVAARPLGGKPTGTPSPRHSPTPTALPSPTATATLSPTATATPSAAPSPTFTAAPTTIAPARATAPASAAPPAKAATPSPTEKPRVIHGQTPVSPLPTSSTGGPAVHPLSRIQQQGRVAFLPLVVMGILSGVATCALLVAVGRLLLRKWLMPVRKVKVPPSGAAPWQRVRPTSPPGSMDSSGYNMQNRRDRKK